MSDIKKYIIFILISFSLLACDNNEKSKQSDSHSLIQDQGEEYETEISSKVEDETVSESKSEDNNEVAIEIKEYDVTGQNFLFEKWDSFLSGQVLNPLDNTFFTGNIKSINVWSLEGSDKELVISNIYDNNGLILKERLYNRGDESGWDYSYDNFGRLSVKDKILLGRALSDNQLTYKYLMSDSDKDEIAREVFKNGALYRVETEVTRSNESILEVEYYSNQENERHTLTFSDGKPIKYVFRSDYRYTYDFDYDLNGSLVKVNEDSMFIYNFESDERESQVRCFVWDNRVNPQQIIREEILSDFDTKGNWLRKEIFIDETLVSVFEREILYY